MIVKNITNNDVDNWVLINPTKPIYAELPKEESQMFFGKEYNYNPSNDDKSIRGIDNKNIVIANSNNIYRINSSISETDYSGIINMKVPTLVNDDLCQVTFFKEDVWEVKTFFENIYITKFKKVGNLQFINIPSNIFKKNSDESNTDFENFINDYGYFYIQIEPLYIDSEIININTKEHYNYDSDLSSLTNEQGNRRNIYTLDILNFKNTPFNFERSYDINILKAIWSNRLLGSLVYNKDLFDNDKNIKIITGDYFNFNTDEAYITISPDYMGVDSPNGKFSIGDKLKIYPTESYFEPITIQINFTREINENEQIKKFLLNDAVRDFSNNIIEVYDDNGLTIEENGEVSGKVYLSFQVSEKQGKEIRKKLN
jgi:hypothetical protein